MKWIKRVTPKFIKAYYHHRLIEIYVLSYPKAGRTWLRMLLASAIDEVFGLNLEDKVKTSTLRLTHNIKEVPTLQFSHDDDPGRTDYRKLNLNKAKFLNKKVVLLIRDPRDVVVSSYYQYKFRDSLEAVQDMTMSEYIRGNTGGLKSIIQYMNSWANYIGKHPNLLVIRYEELQENGVKTLSSFFKFINIPVSDNITRKALEDNSFNRLKKKEESGRLNKKFFSQSGSQTNSKVRKGKVGGYREEVSEDDIAWMDNIIRENLDKAFEYYIR